MDWNTIKDFDSLKWALMSVHKGKNENMKKLLDHGPRIEHLEKFEAVHIEFHKSYNELVKKLDKRLWLFVYAIGIQMVISILTGVQKLMG